MSEQEKQLPPQENEVKTTKEVSYKTLYEIKQAAEFGYYGNNPQSAKHKLHDIMMLMKGILEKKD